LNNNKLNATLEQHIALSQRMFNLLCLAVERVTIANLQDDPILSVWLPCAQNAISEARKIGFFFE